MKPIRFEHDGKNYALDFTLDTAASANADGFVLGELGDKPAQMIPKLVYWSFVHHQKGISRKKACMGPGTYPGQKHAFDPEGWYYKDSSGTKVHSFGNPPAAPMYGAIKDIELELETIAREVFA